MKLYKSILAAAAVAIGVAGLTGCQDHFDDWNLSAPVADIKANISILDFKKVFWQNSDNYCVEIPAKEDGSHYIVSGRVISSDAEGNVFKCLYIQDETAALAISINQYSLYANYRVGQEVVIDLTGLHCGRYSGGFQIGAMDYDNQTGDDLTTFLSPEIFTQHRQLNGDPKPELVDTFLIEDLSDVTNDLPKWQGQLVRFNNVTWTNASNPENDQLCNEYHSSGYNQPFSGKFGNINARTSGYSTFWNTKLPTDACDVVGILSYYSGSSPWQVILNDLAGIMNIGDPTAEGIKTKPYTVERAIELSAADNTTGWVKGYIVGTIQPEITTIASNADIQWVGTEPYIVDNYLVIAASPEIRDYTKCLLIPIAANSALYTYGNLAQHPDNAGRTLNIYGRFSKSMGMAALAGNDGTAPSFVLEGINVPGSDEPAPDQPVEGDGTEAKPYTCAQLQTLGNPGTVGAWVTGYIVGVMNYVDGTGNVFSATELTTNSNIVIASSPTSKDYVAVQIPAGAVRDALNLVNNPGNLGKEVSVCGDLVKYCGIAGVKNTSAYKLDGQSSGGGGDTPAPGGSGSGTEADPYNAPAVIALGNPGTTGVWVKGTIVGVMNYIDGKGNVFSKTELTTNSNIVIASSATATDYVAVQLPAGAVRDALNLVNNPGNLGKEVSVCGDLIKYCGIAGVKNTSAYKLDGQSSGGDTSPSPGSTDGDGTETKPYTVTDILQLNNPGTTAWVEGYIVGTSDGTNGAFEPVNFTADGKNSMTNLLIAATADETNIAKLVPVQLPAGDIRTQLNLVNHPENLGKKILLEGKLEKYFNRVGVKGTSAYKL